MKLKTQCVFLLTLILATFSTTAFADQPVRQPLCVMTYNVDLGGSGKKLMSVEGIGATRDAAELQAKEDAKADAKLLQHCAIGCLLPFISMVSEEILPPRPPAHRLLGKSPQYVQYYTPAYQQHIRNLRRNALLVGSLVGITSVGGCIVLLFSAWG